MCTAMLISSQINFNDVLHHSNKLDDSTMKSKSVGAGAASMNVGMSDNTFGKFLFHPTISYKLVCSWGM